MKKLLYMITGIVIMTITSALAAGGTTFDGLLYEESTFTLMGMREVTGYIIRGCDSTLLPKDVIIPSEIDGLPVLAISPYSSEAFSNADIESISIPSSVLYIYGNSFLGCDKLTNVNLSKGLVSVGNNVFSGCTALKELTIPEGVTEIGSGIISGCTGLERLSLPGSLNSIDFDDLGNNDDTFNITDIEFGEGVQTLSLKGFPALTHLEYPESVLSINLVDFPALEDLELREGLTSVYFSNCTGIKKIDLNSLASCSVYGCDDLESITIPGTMTWIDSTYLSWCPNLKTIIMKQGVQEVYFDSLPSLVDIEIPGSVKKMHLHYMDSLTTVDVPEGVEEASFTMCKKLETVHLPSTLTKIPSNAFESCEALKSIVIPDGVTVIESNAFYSCGSLEKIQLPDTAGGDFKIEGVIDYSYLTGAKPTIYCYDFSYGESYAIANNHPYVIMDGKTFDDVGSIEMPSSFTLKVGGSKVVRPSMFPHLDTMPTVSFSSSDPNIATVSADGTVEAHKKGTATITATAGTISGSTTVNVIAPLESFSVKKDLWIEGRNSKQIVLKDVTPTDAEYTISYSSADSTIAAVDSNGLVTGGAPGTVKVTVVSGNGIRAVVTVHVTYPVTVLAFTDDIYEMNIGEQTQVTAIATPRRGDPVENNLTDFTVSNTNKLAVDEDGVVDALSVGVANITATTQSGMTTSCAVIVHSAEQIILPSGVGEVEEESFSNSGIIEVVIPANVDTIGARAFSDDQSLRLVVFEGMNTSIGAGVFDGCPDVTIVCASGSDAEAYAIAEGIDYLTY